MNKETSAWVAAGFKEKKERCQREQRAKIGTSAFVIKTNEARRTRKKSPAARRKGTNK